MIDINELRRLAQAATPGPWIAKNVSGAGLEIYMSYPLYPDKEWPAFGTDSAFCKKGLVSYETWTQFPHDVRDAQQSINAKYIAAANPAVVSELLDRLEAAESECLEQARLNGMGGEREAALMAKLEAAEKSDAESIAMYRKARDERDALRAKVAAMEKERDALRTAVRHEADCVEAAMAEIKSLRAEIEAAIESAIEMIDRLEATQALAERYNKAAEIYAAERDHANQRYSSAVRLLTGIHALLYPPRFTDHDGRTWQFKSPLVEEQMQELSDRIRALPDEIARTALEKSK